MPVDNSPPRPDPVPEARAEAEAFVAKPQDMRAVAEQNRVDAEAGTFLEQAEVDQVRAEGRPTDTDEDELVAADGTFQDATAYGEALKAAVGCLI
ncbi:hypothetical protein [Antarcticirhabdus aurantiaca]|uniref:Uncharacterized protein n=1 Tax=Antarcticirhabdus aurantiaca TaxID=2606717 RepID=A0ACD4NHL3_9HYPH|nr:hypothetical protein [Antarcticirhabdus aurantiaca]WAJ26289.1 hypothetical protein OXU80_15410 [Jeongeuplla avenae]